MIGGWRGREGFARTNHRNETKRTGNVEDGSAEEYVKRSEIFVAPLPLYHIYAFQMHTLALFHGGAHSILIPDPRDFPALIKAIKPYQFTGFLGINTLFNALCGYQPFKQLDFSKIFLISFNFYKYVGFKFT